MCLVDLCMCFFSPSHYLWAKSWEQLRSLAWGTVAMVLFFFPLRRCFVWCCRVVSSQRKMHWCVDTSLCPLSLRIGKLTSLGDGHCWLRCLDRTSGLVWGKKNILNCPSVNQQKLNEYIWQLFAIIFFPRNTEIRLLFNSSSECCHCGERGLSGSVFWRVSAFIFFIMESSNKLCIFAHLPCSSSKLDL